MTAKPSEPGASPGERLLVGRFGAVHGVRGEIRIKSFTADPLDLARYRDVQTRDGRRLQIARSRHVKDDMLVVSLSGVADRSAAEALVNQDIFIDRAQLPPAEEEEFYLADLIGLEARLTSGERFGVIRNVVNFGAGDILEIEREGAESALLPFTKAVAPEVRIADRFVLVVPPEEVDGEEGR